MRRMLILLCLGATSVCLLSPPVLAQYEQKHVATDAAQSINPAMVQELLRIIGTQQRQLDTQQGQLEAQQKQLQELRRQVQALAEDQETPQTPVAEKTSPVPPGGVTSRRTETQTARRDKEHPHDEWEGSFGVEGLNTRFKIGGFAELDVIHDSDAIGTPGEFVTSAIVTRDATKVEGADGQTNFSVNPSRLYVETRTPLNQHRLTTFLSFDLFGDSTSTTPEPRLRQAYGEVTNILFGGDLLAGQAWSTFADLEASPNTLDFEGPNSTFGLRQPLVRWTRGITDGLKLMVAAETPDNHTIQGADALTAWPDGVLSLVWDQAPVHLMGAFLARELRASLDNGPTQTAFAWGGQCLRQSGDAIYNGKGLYDLLRHIRRRHWKWF